MKNRILILICLTLVIAKVGAQESEYIEIKGKELSMPLLIQKSYGAWTIAETKAIMSPAELNSRLKDTEKIESAKEYEKNPKLVLQKANIILLKAKNASLGVTLYFYSYHNIPDYLSLTSNEMHDLWMGRIKPNTKTFKKLTDESYGNFSASKGDGTVDGKPVSFYFYTNATDSESNTVVIYTIPKQNANKGVKFFGETFGRDWDSGENLDGGH